MSPSNTARRAAESCEASAFPASSELPSSSSAPPSAVMVSGARSSKPTVTDAVPLPATDTIFTCVGVTTLRVGPVSVVDSPHAKASWNPF
jgi:hypothetical protein